MNMNTPSPVQPSRKLVKMLKSTQKIRKLIQWYMIKAKLTEYLPWTKTAWVTSSIPVEILWGLHIFPLHPENNALHPHKRQRNHHA